MTEGVLMAARFAGKVGIITGAGSGIGKATIERFVSEGGSAIAVDISEARLTQLEQEFHSRNQLIKCVSGDLASESTINEILIVAGERIDILINNAGIMDDFVPLDELDDQLWDRVIAVNLTSVMKLSRAVIKKMLVQGKGSIVTTSSGAAFKSGIAGTAYTTSKHGLNGLIKSIATIYGSRGIRSNAVAPGGTKTNIMDMTKPIRGQKTMELLGANMANAPRAAEPQEVAACILFLASDDASNVNGTILASDSGWIAK
jgi:NAD(P)-dependent dehydrogenase (short-subunit alcohol dehydrogenase family)